MALFRLTDSFRLRITYLSSLRSRQMTQLDGQYALSCLRSVIPPRRLVGIPTVVRTAQRGIPRCARNDDPSLYLFKQFLSGRKDERKVEGVGEFGGCRPGNTDKRNARKIARRQVNDEHLGHKFVACSAGAESVLLG